MTAPAATPPPAKNTSPNLLTTKLAVIGALTLALLIPILLVGSVINERQERRNEAVAEITSTWGNPQSIVGPILIIPYRHFYTVEKEFREDGKTVTREVTQSAIDYAYFLPESLEVNGRVAPKRLHRGIYDAVVYTGRLDIDAGFAAPDWQALKIPETEVLWDDAVISFAISDLRGAKGALQLTFGDASFVMLPGTKVPGYSSGAHVMVGHAAQRRSKLSLSIDLNGSRSIHFAPLGIRNAISIVSEWPHPKFQGAFLPTERQVSADGFEARWEVSYYGRDYPQIGSRRAGGIPDLKAVAPSTFGVEFLPSIDSYRNVERATKYGILFIVLVFAAFFLFEVLAGLKIHPVQYVLVGAGLTLFFLLLLSLSEFSPFWLAYLVAAVSLILTIGLYTATFLGTGRRTGILILGLVIVYGYLYVVLQLQDFSLLMGSLLLLVVLAVFMYLSRKVDWYSIDKPGSL
jgi:inner membrane protein